MTEPDTSKTRGVMVHFFEAIRKQIIVDVSSKTELLMALFEGSSKTASLMAFENRIVVSPQILLPSDPHPVE